MTKHGISIEDLGISNEEMIERVSDKIAERMLYGLYDTDEDGNQLEDSSSFQKAIEKRVNEKIDEAVEKIAAKHVLPNMKDFIEGYCLQKTNEWGEAKGGSLTFTEYLVERAHAYMTEPVNHNGKTKAEDSYSWRANTTRIAYQIDHHLQYAISVAMQEALKDANSKISDGLAKAVRISLDQIKNGLKVDVKVGR